ncbi:hypothetical protein HRbin14_01881 [bacterium HR14]|nr:hypothetical protein HRbin14_01881 [bacterium HR14]
MHNCGQHCGIGAPLVAIIGQAERHQQRAEIGVPQPQRTEVVAVVRNPLGGVRRVVHDNLLRCDERAHRRPIRLHIEAAIRQAELHQVQAREVAGGIVQEHKFRAVGNNKPINDVSMMNRLSQVVGQLISVELALHKMRIGAYRVELMFLNPALKDLLLAGSRKADIVVEAPNRGSRDAQVVAVAMREIGHLLTVALARVAELRLLGRLRVDTALDTEHQQQLLHLLQEGERFAPQSDIAGALFLVVAGASISGKQPAQVSCHDFGRRSENRFRHAFVSGFGLLHAQRLQETTERSSHDAQLGGTVGLLADVRMQSQRLQHSAVARQQLFLLFSAAVCPDYHRAGVHKAAVAREMPQHLRKGHRPLRGQV